MKQYHEALFLSYRRRTECSISQFCNTNVKCAYSGFRLSVKWLQLSRSLSRLLGCVARQIVRRCWGGGGGMITFCRRKGALQNVNMLTVSKSGHSYMPGKLLSSDLRHIIIDKIIDGGGNPLTMIFPGRFINLVSIEHASVLARDPLLPSQSCFLLCEYQYLRLA